MLDDYNPRAHNLRPCFLDPRDEKITWLTTPNPERFRELVALAQSDPKFKLPIDVKKFFAGVEDLPGLSVERLNADENYDTIAGEEQKSARARKVQNDYSLYEPLDHDKREIRIALLLQGPKEAPINVVIVRMSYPWTQRAYMALSYCWGPLGETRPIYVGHAARKVGEKEKTGLRDQGFDCTAGLEIALQGLRQEDQFVAVWIDALCINQADPEERAYQVSIMSEIYANAASVCIWLNLEEEQSIAMQAIRTIGTEKDRVRAEKDVPDSVSDVRMVQMMLRNGSFMSTKGAVTTEYILQILTGLFKNPWFRRVWVLQEVSSARGEVFLLGNNAPAVSWSHVLFADLFISVAYKFLRLKISGLTQPWRDFERNERGPAGGSPQRVPILELFEGVCQQFDATDTRDKLFGLLAMGQETHDILALSPLIAPDYRKSVSQVYIDFTKWCIITSRSLAVLGYVTFLRRGHLSGSDRLTLPTWSLSPVPKFDGHGSKLSEVPEFHASGDMELDLELIIASSKNATPSLQLGGCRLDTISNVSKMYFSNRWYDNSDLYIMNPETNTYYSGGLKYIWSQVGWGGRRAYDYRFLTTLTCGGMQQHGNCDRAKGVHRTKWFKASDMYQDFAAHWARNQKEDPQNGGDQEMKLFCPHVRELLLPLAEKGSADNFAELLLNASRKAFGTTNHGRLGMCPPGTREGDVVVALFGGKAPFVLRRLEHTASSEADGWEFLGECYFQDFMDGQHVRRKLTDNDPGEIFDLRCSSI
ncbi:hypothetical protein LTR51_000035 [Lithohypha guttulata]|nr:hypothetical protein LTR51_000035 [Lithohypha guttulata]